MVQLPQVVELNMIVSAGGIRIAGNPIKISNLPDSSTQRAAPALDSDGERIRAEFTPARS
jgi:CoA:oxalate CoA-transferase